MREHVFFLISDFFLLTSNNDGSYTILTDVFYQVEDVNLFSYTSKYLL
jgi:hypothetical protein